MPRNDDGEFELVLGNRQLLSGFFLVVILFGVFFTMGYIVGRHTSPSPAMESAASVNPPAAMSAPAEPAALPPGQAEVVAAAPPDKPLTTHPAKESPAAESKPRSAASTHVAASAAPAPGETYLQVSAPKRDAAPGVIEALRKKGIEPVLAPGPDEDTVRVLVGPFKDATVMGKTRAEVESAGFKPFVRKY